jgi:hypothetical protein
MAADRPYGEFYDFYSVSPEYFGYTLVHLHIRLLTSSVSVLVSLHVAMNFKEPS